MKRGIDYIGVGIGAVIVNDDNKYLLTKRGKKAKNERGKWEFPGGGIEFGDTMIDTIKREMMEELGIEIEILDHLPPIDHIIPDENQHWVTSGVISKVVKGIPTIMEPDKCDEIGWFLIEEMKSMNLSIPTTKYISILENRS